MSTNMPTVAFENDNGRAEAADGGVNGDNPIPKAMQLLSTFNGSANNNVLNMLMGSFWTC